MKLLAVLVIYMPDDSDYNQIVSNIKRYINGIDALIVWDNTPSLDHKDVLRIHLKELMDDQEFMKLIFMSSGCNCGLSYAYNRAIEYAKQNGYTHLLTMDQDSKWESFDKYRSFAEIYYKREPLAIIGPSINEDEQSDILKNVPNIINSGAIIPIALFNKIGGFCERFLVDGVDVEICYRAQRYGIPVYKVKGYGHLVQHFGNMTFFYFNGRLWHCTNYNTFRLKGIVRNHMLIVRNYPEQSDTKERLRNVYLKQYTIAILLKEKHKLSKLWSIYSSLIKGILTTKSLDSTYSKA
jgi:glycosyltransferase, group 2 family protein